MTRSVGIIGHPVAHSLSPIFQGAAFRAHGLDISYERWDTPGELLPARIASLRDPSCLGANVTIPHNCSAVVHVPAKDPSSIREGGQSAQKSPGVHLLRTESEVAVFEVKSGSYGFEAD